MLMLTTGEQTTTRKKRGQEKPGKNRQHQMGSASLAIHRIRKRRQVVESEEQTRAYTATRNRRKTRNTEKTWDGSQILKETFGRATTAYTSGQRTKVHRRFGT